MTLQKNRPELLAPAGSLESFFAAMEKGADAVYAGLQDFSARARAKNFSLSQMERMLGYAHAHDRRIYITLNTLVKEQELPQLVDTLAALDAMRVDGVIVQDLAVARLVRNHFPAIPLHASTQMTIHNTAGVQMLAELGFQRAVLARELALDEIATIAAATPVEIETFVHGALCFSISGQCFFSSYLGGHSGNRGRCAQPCRRLYDHRGKQGHFFSTSDLSAIDMLPDLVRAGVKSLKIEGRMKSAEYVASVVEAYRLVLDAPEQTLKDALPAAKEILKFSFGRTPTKGFLASQQPEDIANPWQKGGTGRYVGQIRSIKGKRLTFDTRDALLRGRPPAGTAQNRHGRPGLDGARDLRQQQEDHGGQGRQHRGGGDPLPLRGRRLHLQGLVEGGLHPQRERLPAAAGFGAGGQAAPAGCDSASMTTRSASPPTWPVPGTNSATPWGRWKRPAAAIWSASSPASSQRPGTRPSAWNRWRRPISRPS